MGRAKGDHVGVTNHHDVVMASPYLRHNPGAGCIGRQAMRLGRNGVNSMILPNAAQAIDPAILASLNGLSQADMIAKVAQLMADNTKLKKANNGKLSLKVSEKGALSIYGMGKWPITLYLSQWERVMANLDQIKAFVEANRDQFSVKE